MSWTATPNINTGGSRKGGILLGNQYFNVFQCEQVVSPATISLPAGSGTTTVNVVSSGSCPWTAAAPSGSLASVTGGASGTGQGPVTISYTANPTIQQRSTIVTVAGQPVTLTQAGATCTFALSPASINLGAAGGSGNVSVSAPGGCTWAPNSNASWLTPGSSSQQQGNGTMSWTASPNIGTGGSREGGILIGNQYFNLFQCEQVVTPSTASLPAGSGTTTINVVSSGSCPWTATVSSGSFATITGGATGTGQGPVTISYSANPTIQQRSTVVTVAGQPVTLTQAAATCTYTLSPGTAAIGAEGGNGSFSVYASPSECTWTPNSTGSWLAPGSTQQQQGNGTVTWSATPNINTGGSRQAGILIGTEHFWLTQCEQVVGTRLIRTAATAGMARVDVTTQGPSAVIGSCSWTATVPSGSFVEITEGAFGTGSGFVTLDIEANPTINPRMTTVTIAGQPVTTEQTGATCSYTLTPSWHRISQEGSSGSVEVVPSAPECTWSANSSAEWLSVGNTSLHQGAGTFTWSATSNATGSVRDAVIALGGGASGQHVQLTQLSASTFQCAYSLDTNTIYVSAEGHKASVLAAALAGCEWSSSEQSAFISLLGSGTGVGRGAVTLEFTNNTDAAPRIATVTIAGNSLHVVQAGNTGATCEYAIQPADLDFAAAGGSATLTITPNYANCPWTVVSSRPWVNVSVVSGVGAGTIDIQIEPNRNAETLNAVLSIAGSEAYIEVAAEQPAPPPGSGFICPPQVSPSSLAVGHSGGSVSVEVVASDDCNWTASTNSKLIRILEGIPRSGSRTVLLEVEPNTTGVPRYGVVDVGGQAVLLTQTPDPEMTPPSVPAASTPLMLGPWFGFDEDLTQTDAIYPPFQNPRACHGNCGSGCAPEMDIPIFNRCAGTQFLEFIPSGPPTLYAQEWRESCGPAFIQRFRYDIYRADGEWRYHGTWSPLCHSHDTVCRTQGAFACFMAALNIRHLDCGTIERRIWFYLGPAYAEDRFPRASETTSESCQIPPD